MDSLKIKYTSPQHERILIANPQKYVPEFGIIEISHITEVKQDMPDLDVWAFEVHLYDGRVRVLSFEDEKDAVWLYERFFTLLEKDRAAT